MKTITRSCDGCKVEIVGSQYWTVEWGHAGCITAKAEICEACRKKMESTVGLDWQAVRDANKREILE